MPTRKVFIVGGTGQIGQAIAHEFIAEDWDVQIGHRPGKPAPADLLALGVGVAPLNREATRELARVLSAGADVVVDTIAYRPEHAAQWLELQADVGAFVIISSASVYRDARGRSLDEARQTGFPDFGGLIAERQATVDPGPETYSTRKVALEQAMLNGARRPTVILRPGAIHGLGCRAPREWWFLKRAMDGRTRVPVAYGGESRFHTTATANIARLALATVNSGLSGAFNIGDPIAPSVREIGQMIGVAMAHDWRIEGLAKHPVGAVGATPWSVPRPFLLDCSKAKALGYEPAVGYADSIAQTCQDLVKRTSDRPWREAFPGLAAYGEPWFDYAAEDVFFEFA